MSSPSRVHEDVLHRFLIERANVRGVLVPSVRRLTPQCKGQPLT